ncbi:MAG: hypothetical protein MZU84_03700 [Sphingobacterium sp.]|nr:hypothetical protein [Sphingobacterium sp.]
MDNKSRLYGDNNPALTATYTGLKRAEDENLFSLSTPANILSNVGNYNINLGYTTSNYNVTNNTGSLIINPAPLSISANNATKIYGDANPAFSVTYSGFKNSENQSVLGGTLGFATPATQFSNVGSYAVTPSGYTSSNYTISYNNGSLTINPAPLTVVIDNKSRLYGDNNPTFTAAFTGLKRAQDENLFSFKTNANKSSNVGLYSITPNTMIGSNYTPVYTNGVLNISKADLVINANNKTKFMGENNPEFDVTYIGFKNNENQNNLSGNFDYINRCN